MAVININRYNDAIKDGYHYVCPKCGNKFFINIVPFTKFKECRCGIKFPKIIYSKEKNKIIEV